MRRLNALAGNLSRHVLVPMLAVTLASCAATGGDAGNSESASEVPVVTTPATGGVESTATVGQVVARQPLTNDIMYDILLGEIAGQRGAMDVSVERYLEAARVARDPRVAERAMQIASFAKRYELAYEAAQRWVSLDGDNVDARKALTALALQQGDLDEVVIQMDHLLSESADPEESFRMVTLLLARHEDKQAAVRATRRLVDRFPGSPHAWTALCRLAVLADDLDTALNAVEHALQLQPGLPDAIILKAQVLVRQERKPEATRLLGDAVDRDPKNTDLLFAYGRMLLDGDDIEGAKQQFSRVVAIDPRHTDALYSLALLELETENYRAGEKHLKQLLEHKHHVQNAYYYLGYATMEQGRDAEALDWFLKVESGDYWRQAQLRGASIMVKQGDLGRMQDYMRTLRQKHPQMAVQLFVIEGQVLTDAGLHQQAFEHYATALRHTPDEEDLLYSYALSAEKLGKLDIAEQSMRKILANDPDNVRTLNALGYTLADRTDRYQEALQYISKAYAREPDDPAIIDSMGWVHYRLGDLDKALEYLQQAWEMSKDSEIGAHLGEVLWVRGDRDAARAVWEASRKAMPDNPVLLEVLNRLNP
ncbi:MAG: tetratricopeptide repeat protein [Thiohalobacterales bacterium]|nr:tetratricopeptide repeat protein [Thiohalobacterales bacterium]